jgi:hypothetical protein
MWWQQQRADRQTDRPADERNPGRTKSHQEISREWLTEYRPLKASKIEARRSGTLAAGSRPIPPRTRRRSRALLPVLLPSAIFARLPVCMRAGLTTCSRACVVCRYVYACSCLCLSMCACACAHACMRACVVSYAQVAVRFNKTEELRKLTSDATSFFPVEFDSCDAVGVRRAFVRQRRALAGV